MVDHKSIIEAIEKYGISCELELDSFKSIKFKGIIYSPNNSPHQNQTDFFRSDPYDSSFSILIIADPNILNYLSTNLIIKTIDSKYQILKCKKFIVSDKVYYVSSTLAPI